jgi:hypothetical protein
MQNPSQPLGKKGPMKTACEIMRFIHAYLAANDQVKATGEKADIKGYSGWWVMPIKEKTDE